MHFVVAMQNSVNHGPNCFTYAGTKHVFPAETKPDMRKLWYLCGEVCVNTMLAKR